MNKTVLLLNLLFSGLLSVAFLTPHLSVMDFPFLSVFALAVPFLFIVNVLFVLYWSLLRKKQAFISLMVLGLCYLVLDPFYKLSITEEQEERTQGNLKVMTYNVQEFSYSRSKSSKVLDFVISQDPDIVGMQEFSMEGREKFKKAYPYNYRTQGGTGKSAQAIFSKYPIISQEHIKFPNSANSALAADILFKEDTIRVYVAHLQSLRIRPEMLKREKSDHLYARLTKSFAQQESQVTMLKAHMGKSPYSSIVCADMNNAQYSHVYNILKGEYKDTFLEQGAGFGRTLNFWLFPLRIDFILADENFDTKTHQNFDFDSSDHFPLMATFDLVH